MLNKTMYILKRNAHVILYLATDTFDGVYFYQCEFQNTKVNLQVTTLKIRVKLTNNF